MQIKAETLSPNSPRECEKDRKDENDKHRPCCSKCCRNCSAQLVLAHNGKKQWGGGVPRGEEIHLGWGQTFLKHGWFAHAHAHVQAQAHAHAHPYSQAQAHAHPYK